MKFTFVPEYRFAAFDLASAEFLRVLKVGGHFIVASAGIDHLNGLKKVLYDETYKNEEKIFAIMKTSS